MAPSSPYPGITPPPTFQTITPSSPYQWGEVSSTQDLAAATYLREFEEAYRGLPAGYVQQHQIIAQSQQNLIQNEQQLSENCHLQTEYYQTGFSSDNDFFQPSEIFHLDQPLTELKYENLRTNRFENPQIPPPLQLTEINRLENQFSHPPPPPPPPPLAQCKYAPEDRLVHEKIEFDNPGDYPDIYTFPPHRDNQKFPLYNQERANNQTFSEDFPSVSNYSGFEYTQSPDVLDWRLLQEDGPQRVNVYPERVRSGRMNQGPSSGPVNFDVALL